MHEVDVKRLAIKVIRDTWPTVRINEANVTPDVADYVFRVVAAAKEGHQFVKSLSPFLGPATSWRGIALKLLQAIKKYTEEDKDWGLAIRAGVAMHTRAIQAAMSYGTEDYPLQFR